MVTGGVVATLLECHGNWTAAIELMDTSSLPKPPLTVTYSILVTFREPTPPNTPLVIRSKVCFAHATDAVDVKNAWWIGDKILTTYHRTAKYSNTEYVFFFNFELVIVPNLESECPNFGTEFLGRYRKKTPHFYVGMFSASIWKWECLNIYQSYSALQDEVATTGTPCFIVSSGGAEICSFCDVHACSCSFQRHTWHEYKRLLWFRWSPRCPMTQTLSNSYCLRSSEGLNLHDVGRGGWNSGALCNFHLKHVKTYERLLETSIGTITLEQAQRGSTQSEFSTKWTKTRCKEKQPSFSL